MLKDAGMGKLVPAIQLRSLTHLFVSKVSWCLLLYACSGPDVNLNIKQEAMDDDDETKCWTNGTDAEKSKTKQQLVGESLLSHILKEVIF